MIQIDGSTGEGGGQVLRTSLSLSIISQKPFTMKNIRARRSKPGLMRQHLTAVKAAQQISNAEIKGDTVGSTELTFVPNPIQAGDFDFSVGTAGSTVLVFQTILPALMIAGRPSTLTLSGGTHNPMSPPFDFLQKTFLPQIKCLGPHADVELLKYGFFPAGGGSFRSTITSSNSLNPFELLERGEFIRHTAHAYVAKIPEHVGKRELKEVKKKLNWTETDLQLHVVDSHGPGNAIMLEVEYEHITELFTAFGQRGKPAEEVANDAIQQYRKYTKHNIPVGEYLTDQLLLPLAIAGSGQFRTLGFSSHAQTQSQLIQSFMDVSFDMEKEDEGYLVTVR